MINKFEKPLKQKKTFEPKKMHNDLISGAGKFKNLNNKTEGVSISYFEKSSKCFLLP